MIINLEGLHNDIIARIMIETQRSAMNFQEALGIVLRTDEFSFFTRQYTKGSHAGTVFSVAGDFADLQFAGLTGFRKRTILLRTLFATLAIADFFGKATAFFI